MVELWRDFWIHETRTGQQVAQLHERYRMMMMINNHYNIINFVLHHRHSTEAVIYLTILAISQTTWCRKWQKDWWTGIWQDAVRNSYHLTGVPAGWHAPFYFSPSWSSWTFLVAYSKAMVTKHLPHFRGFWLENASYKWLHRVNLRTFQLVQLF